MFAPRSSADYSAELCPRASVADLAPMAVDRFRQLWIKRSKNQALGQLGPGSSRCS
ncbi:MAG: hypothetical protein AB7N76_13275 [Planctomycetota bacterium]